MSPLHFEELDQTRTIVFQSKAICIEYIYARLAEEELILPVTEYEHLKSSGTPEEVFAVLLKLSDEMESLCPYMYRDIAKQMNIQLDVENVVADAFFTLAMDITASGVTWGKVVAIYALAGALAVDCVYQGQTAMIYAIVDSMGVFTYKYLSPWLLHRGGWGVLKSSVSWGLGELGTEKQL
ncbi:bcl-2-related ovarian killer protein homolog B-like [Engraulis encrasicolus]|uniref:bcl-2-related ovarian killer protein homolog B-like n=1 Tax=Engraulis encrasicolus TaxID=184585 RepID=UPI002FD39B2D